MAGRELLELQGVTKLYGRQAAVSEVSLAVKEGEFLTLLGASGSGKSTVLMMVAGFEEPSRGEIYLRGQSLKGVPAHRRKIGVVFQNYALFPHLSVYDNLAFSLRNLNWSADQIRERVTSLLRSVEMEQYASRQPGQLSGGQQQRVAVARALAFEPEVLLFDEPLGALDRRLRQHMVVELQEMHRRLRTTMIYVTHDQEEALIMSDRIAVMDNGRIVAIDTPERLYDAPPSAFVATFLGHSNILDKGARSLAIRPEKIVIGAAPVSGWQSSRATVVSRTFLGESTRYVVRAEEDRELTITELRRNGASPHQPGEQVWIAWHPQDAVVLQDARSA